MWMLLLLIDPKMIFLGIPLFLFICVFLTLVHLFRSPCVGNPRLSWTLVILFFPLLGPLLYWIFQGFRKYPSAPQELESNISAKTLE